MKAIEQNQDFPMTPFIMLCKVVPTFETVNKMLKFTCGD